MNYQEPYYNQLHPKQLIADLNEWRRNAKHCDIILVADGIEINTHKILLSACSPYFHAMFTNFEEKEKGRIVLKDIAGITLQILVDYMYTGEITVDEDTAQDVLQAAIYLHLKQVKNFCCKFIESQLQITNCLDIATLAKSLGCADLLTKANMYMQSHFSELVKCEEFLLSTCQQVITLISNDRLAISKEEEVFECVMLWVTHNLSEREVFLANLLEHVRLPFVSENYLSEKVQTEPLIKNNGKCMCYVDEAKEIRSLDLNQQKFKSPRTNRRMSKVFLVIGGSISKPDNIEWFDITQKSFTRMTDLSDKRDRYCAAVINGCIYFVGGFVRRNITKSMDMFDYVRNAWSSCASMNTIRRCFAVATVDKTIYVMGGLPPGGFCGNYRPRAISCAEKYDIETLKWKNIRSMLYGRSNFSVAVIDGLIYAVGGTFDRDRQQIESEITSIERYCPKTDQWNMVANMIYPRKSPGVCVLDGLLYVIGGRNDVNRRERVAEVYDPKVNKWSKIPCMTKQRVDGGVAALDGCLYAIGGDDECTVEAYDPQLNTWTLLSLGTNVRRSFHRLAVIDRPY